VSEDPSIRIIVNEKGKYSCQRADAYGDWKTLTSSYDRQGLNKQMMRIHGIDVSFLPVTREDQRGKIIDLADKTNRNVLIALHSLQSIRKKLSYSDKSVLESIDHFLTGTMDATEDIKDILLEIDSDLFATKRPE
jgi:hypothetical protein